MAGDGNPEVNLETGSHPNGGEEGQTFDVQGVGQREMGHIERYIYHQVQLYADEESDSTEIKQKKRMARTALSLWKEESEKFNSQILQMKSEMRSVMNEVYQLVSLYSVFEGVVWTAVATSSRLECRHIWSPVGFSLFVYSMVVFVAFTKFREIQELQSDREVRVGIINEVSLRVSQLKLKGFVDSDFARDFEEKMWHTQKVPFWRNALSLIVPLTMFTIGLVVSLCHILCWS